MRSITSFCGSCITITLVCLVLLCTACKSKKRLATVDADLNKNQLIDIVNSHSIDYQTYAASAKIRFASELESINGRAHIRVIRDSIVWVQLKKFGFEFARIMINPDSVYIVYKMDRSYEKGSIEDLSRAFDLELDFQKLQTFIIGNTLPPDPSLTEFKKIDNQYLMHTQSGRYVVDYVIDPAIQHVTEYNIQEGRDRDVTITYGDYKPIVEGGREFSYFRKYVAQDASSVSSIEINISAIEFDKTFDIRFEIPPNYYKL